MTKALLVTLAFSLAPITILELQPFRQSSSITVRSKSGPEGSATLVNLNPAINTWYLLKVTLKNAPETAYHLENLKPSAARLFVEESYPAGLVITTGKDRYFCELFTGDVLSRARASQLIYSPLCEGRIYLRNRATGYRTTLETATEFLRERVWGGEKIISFGHVLMADRYRETGTMQTGAAGAQDARAPKPAQIGPEFGNRLLTSGGLGIDLAGKEKTGMTPGAWYAANGNSGVYVSILQPNLIDASILQSHKSAVNSLDSVEASALSYLVAFDLDLFDLGYALGAEHPRVDWSAHMLDRMKNPALPGPDGIGNVAPLVSTGLLSPDHARRAVSVFTAGFKRAHGAFQYGDLALKNQGSHYGFIENGVVFSKLQPGLSTLLVLDDGSVAMKTWTETDNRLLPRIRHARQNGVPVVEFDDASQTPVPGHQVTQWGAGNWSGSEDRKLRTMRSGAALQRSNGRRFLIYAVFSSATPSAMVRIFQAYKCDYAMLLDMNALEHTYLAVYRRSGSQLFVDHLVKGMSQVEKTVSGELVPRFLGYADNRDFFYILRRKGAEQ